MRSAEWAVTVEFTPYEMRASSGLTVRPRQSATLAVIAPADATRNDLLRAADEQLHRSYEFVRDITIAAAGLADVPVLA